MSILYRLPEKIRKKLQLKPLPVEPAQTDPLLDWSVRIVTTRFKHDCTFEYILLINEATQYISLCKNPGFNSMEELGKLAAQTLRAQFLLFALRDLYNKRIAPHLQDFRIAKASTRRATAFNTALVHEVACELESDQTIEQVCYRRNNSILGKLMKINGITARTPDQGVVWIFKSQNSNS
ncbi:MAG: hypothetical protein PHQ75_02290 [Thermoguttaceae bacterium]|nr:hypothetical protein [Thermoguttaceae bacterium]